MVTKFVNDETKICGGLFYGRFIETNRKFSIAVDFRNENRIVFQYQSRNNTASNEYDLAVADCITEEDGCEKMMFKTPTGLGAVIYADNRLDSKKYEGA